MYKIFLLNTKFYVNQFSKLYRILGLFSNKFSMYLHTVAQNSKHLICNGYHNGLAFRSSAPQVVVLCPSLVLVSRAVGR